MPLTDLTVKSAKAGDKPMKLADGGGMYLLVSPAGGKLWRLKYRVTGKEKLLALGAYPEVSLAKARERREAARKLLAEGIDPGEQKKVAKAKKAISAENTFESVALKWHASLAAGLSQTTQDKHTQWFNSDIFPVLGKRPIAEIAAPELLVLLRRIDGRGAHDVARRVHNICGRIFRYAVGHGLCVRDPSRDIGLGDILPPPDTKHFASVKDPKEAGALMRAIEDFSGALTTRCALKLAPLVFVRPGELRHAEWSEIDFDAAEWRIPGHKMKMGEQHIVPLSSQAVAILREVQVVNGMGRYVFPSERGGCRPMSENTVNAALRRLGYAKDEMTGHGFRSMASTLLHELGYPHMVIERQLAHGERNKVSAAYNHAEFLAERRVMMQEWADYLDKLKAGAEIVVLRA